MKNFTERAVGTFKVVALAAGVMTLSSCASIVSKSAYSVSINSSPNGANFTIVDRLGNTIHSGMTPQSVVLPAGSGYFSKAEYTVTFEKPGFSKNTAAIQAGLDGWYWGNILFGGLIGLLIVDPATGAMYTLPERVDSTLVSETAMSSGALPELKIVSVNELEVADRARLIPLQSVLAN